MYVMPRGIDAVDAPQFACLRKLHALDGIDALRNPRLQATIAVLGRAVVESIDHGKMAKHAVLDNSDDIQHVFFRPLLCVAAGVRNHWAVRPQHVLRIAAVQRQRGIERFDLLDLDCIAATKHGVRRVGIVAYIGEHPFESIIPFLRFALERPSKQILDVFLQSLSHAVGAVTRSVFTSERDDWVVDEIDDGVDDGCL